jgi:uncharacterized protein with GYD domain
MATFLMFGKYGAESIKGISAARTTKARELVQKLGGELKAGYALLGECDLVLIAELPGTAEALKASVELARATGISFVTAAAVPVDDFDKLVAPGRKAAIG